MTGMISIIMMIISHWLLMDILMMILFLLPSISSRKRLSLPLLVGLICGRERMRESFHGSLMMSNDDDGKHDKDAVDDNDDEADDGCDDDDYDDGCNSDD